MVKYGFKEYINEKKLLSAKEAQFLQNTFSLYDSVVGIFPPQNKKNVTWKWQIN